MKYKRVLLKLSGEALMGKNSYGIDPKRIRAYAEDIKETVDSGAEVAIVLGGGNIFRGLGAADQGIDRVQGDHMGYAGHGDQWAGHAVGAGRNGFANPPSIGHRNG